MTPWREWREAEPGDFAVIGKEVAHSRSPVMHQAAYKALGLDLSYRAIRVDSGEMAPALARLASLGYRGVNVTVGLKEEALAWAEARGGAEGADLGAEPVWGANTLHLVRQTAISTDEPGFLRMLARLGIEPSGPLLLLGAGGSGRALAVALARGGWKIRAWNRTPGKWEAVQGRVGSSMEILERPSLAGVQAVVNCTSAGLHGQSLDLDWSEADHGLQAIDLVYGRETPFLAEARAAGLARHDGTLMLMEQGALSFEWWLTTPAPRGAMLEAICDGDS